MNRFVLSAQKHFPRCLDKHAVATSVEMPPSWTDSNADFVASFDLSCRCGIEHLQVIGIPDEELGLFSPIRTHCTACGRDELLFDVSKHGHDVELGESSSYVSREGEMRELKCSSCENTHFSVIPWFTYQFEPDDLADIPSTKISNYFDGFGIDLICSKCKTINYVGQYECA